MDTEKKYYLIYRNLIIISLIGLALWIIYISRPVFFPLILSVILAYILWTAQPMSDQVTIIVALLIGGELWGVLGMFIAVPIAAILKIFYQRKDRKRLSNLRGRFDLRTGGVKYEF